MIAGFIALLLFSFMMAALALRPKKAEKDLERRLSVISPSHEKHAEIDSVTLLVNRPAGVFHQIGEYVEELNLTADLQSLVVHAGSKATVGSVIGGSMLAALFAGFIAHLTVGSWPLDLAAIAVAGASRWGLLRFQKSSRLQKFNTALPDAIDLIARALRAGHSMISAIEVVSEQSPEPLASEFEMVFQQQKFGIQFRDVLLQLIDRVPSRDLQFLVTAILIQKETGGDLTEVLDRTTRIIRERIRIHGEIQTYTAQGRLTGWILGALPVVMLVIISFITPGYTHVLFYDPTGNKLLYAGAVLIIIGGVVIRKIVDIEV